MKFLKSNVHEHLLVADSTFVYGSLLDGARVPSGVTLFVIGNVSSTVALEPDARMVALGEFSATVTHNAGVLTLAGTVRTPLAVLPGRVTVAVGTAVALGDGFGVLGDDGSITTSPSSELRRELPETCTLRDGRFGPARQDRGLAEFWHQSKAWL